MFWLGTRLIIIDYILVNNSSIIILDQNYILSRVLKTFFKCMGLLDFLRCFDMLLIFSPTPISFKIIQATRRIFPKLKHLKYIASMLSSTEFTDIVHYWWSLGWLAPRSRVRERQEDRLGSQEFFRRQHQRPESCQDREPDRFSYSKFDDTLQVVGVWRYTSRSRVIFWLRARILERYAKYSSICRGSTFESRSS